MNARATATSSGDTNQKKAESGRIDQKKHTATRIPMFSDGNTRTCGSSRQVLPWRPWVRVLPVVRWLRKNGFVVNRVLNEALLDWVGHEGDEKVKLRARLYVLQDEESRLRQTMRVVLRSGSFLPSYAAKLVQGDEKLSVKLGRQPLDAIASKEEADVVRRILARREAIVKEIVEIAGKLLPRERYELRE